MNKSQNQAPVVQTLDSAIHRINHYPADSVIDFRNTYPLDGDLFKVDTATQRLKNWAWTFSRYTPLINN